MPASSPPRDVGTHHAAVLAQPPVTTWCEVDTDVDFLGTKTRRSFVSGMEKAPPARPAEFVTSSYPSFDEEYFEWIDILETVEAATDQYVMIELGAGYGRWSVRAAFAVVARRPSCTFHCVAVEAEPVHFRWMLDHFRDNGINPEDHDVIWAAVGARPGFVPFWIGESDAWYGQSIASKTQDPLPAARTRRRLKARSVLGRPPMMSAAAKSRLWVPSVTLTELLAPYPEVDLIDLDVQGSEFDVLAPAIEVLNERVRRIHIGTHSAQVEEGLRELFGTAGWEKRNDYPCQSRVPTPYGDITFGDGVQTWLNPIRLSRQSHASARRTVLSSAGSPGITALHARILDLEERNRHLKAKAATIPDLKERNRQLEAENMSRSAEVPEVVAALSARVADLKERNRQLKAETSRLRETYDRAQAHGQRKATARWWKRLVPGWLARLRRRFG